MDFLDNTCKENSKTEKKEHHQRILHIRNRVGTKLRLPRQFLIFGPN